jgi:hypothetical protein
VHLPKIYFCAENIKTAQEMERSIPKVKNALKSSAKLSLFLLFFIPASVLGQETDTKLTQTIRGVITDVASGEAIPFASVALEDNPGKGAVTDNDGNFQIDNVPVGRHTVKAMYLGYEPTIIKEIMVSSAKEVYLEIVLKESVHALNEIVVRPRINKEQPLNKMAATGARMFSVEETSRYAGGIDDPARLVSAFAGVSADGNSNGISIHGNAPHLLAWRMEGVEIPNPNHFADISVLGGGILSSLSANVLGNSDFLTGAFPAEYSNAVSGVFDVKLRNGNNQNYEHTAQVGTLGFDFASEGPISRKTGSSYIINYRYSTLGVAEKIGMNMDGQKIQYQDLNMKLNFPTKKAGTFSVWMTGLIDDYISENKDTTEWKSKMDENYSVSKQYMAAGGVGHSYFFRNGGQLKTTLAGTYFKEHAYIDFYDDNMNHSIPYMDMNRNFSNLIADVSHNRKFSSRFINKSGINYTRMFYNMDMTMSPYIGGNLLPVYDGDGSTGLVTAYSSNAFNINNSITLNFGLNAQWLTLNDSWTVEPRLGIKWQPTARSTFAAAYGMHSRMEKIDVYFVETDNQFVNKELDFTKAHHFMLSYGLKLSENTNLKIEPFYQYLYDVPVEADGSYSVLNRSDFYVDKALVNKGKGRNYGVDVTLERYLNQGWYAMLTGSFFNSRYSGGDGVWHDTRYNRKYIVNTLGGKEWMVGKRKQNVFSANLRLTLQGGDRYSPVDLDATLADPDNDVQYDESRAYSRQFDPMFLASFTVSYKINRKNVSHEFAIKYINVTNAESYYAHLYNYHTKDIEPYKGTLAIPNILYKIEF